jgi:hypothetical protein
MGAEDFTMALIRRRALLGAPATIAMTLFHAGCGNAGASDDTDSASGVRTQGTKAEADGILQIGGRRFEFRLITPCDLTDAEIGSPDEMLRGSGTTPAGDRFTVVVDRSSVGVGLSHTVGVTYGDVLGGRGYRAEAARTRSATGWSDEAGTVDQPLIQIDGRSVRAAGRFRENSAGIQSVVVGRLDVICPA